MVKKELEKEGYEVLQKVPVEGMEQRELPNSDPGGDDNWSYQDQPWDPYNRRHKTEK